MIKPDQPFIVHHIEGRRSERIAWLCEELGLPYELKFVSGDVSGSLSALAKAHVMRMAPILEDGPVKMVESGAILEYILVRYGGGRLRPPPDSPEMADYLQWMHFAEGSGMFRAMVERLARQLAGDKPPPRRRLPLCRQQQARARFRRGGPGVPALFRRNELFGGGHHDALSAAPGASGASRRDGGHSLVSRRPYWPCALPERRRIPRSHGCQACFPTRYGGHPAKRTTCNVGIRVSRSSGRLDRASWSWCAYWPSGRAAMADAADRGALAHRILTRRGCVVRGHPLASPHA